MNTGFRQPISVVIATLGGGVLRGTIETLNASSRPPSEILVCVPEPDAASVDVGGSDNVRVVATSFRGQVGQRAAGFREARQEFVLQLDDDMQLAERDLDLLLSSLRSLGPGNAVGPIYLDEATGECIHRQYGGLRGFMQSVNATVIAGAPWGVRRMGRVSPAGTNFGVDVTRCSDELMPTDWLPGGCVLHYRNELVTEDFYPFPGKAFCEDLMHSHLLQEKGVRLWVVRDARCSTSDPMIPSDRDSLARDTRARIHYNRIRGLGTGRLKLWVALSALRRKARIWT